MPVVMAGTWHEAGGISGVGIDDAVGIGQAVAHLADLGHRAIAFPGGPPGHIVSRRRAKGDVDAMARHGPQPRPTDLPKGRFSAEGGAQAAHRWVAAPDRAVGFIGAWDGMGIACPGDASVVGFDDIDLLPRFGPPLRTIHQPRADVRRRVATQLVEFLRNGTAVPEQRESLPTRLIVRGSTAPRH